MKVVEHPLEAYAHVDHWRREGATIGLIPTMGALHAGHLALVSQSREQCDKTIATIFVNPTQFAPHEDFSRYPRTLEEDLRGLRELQTDLVFLPSKEALYPPGFSTYISPPAAALPLEGVFRPEHFRGVTTIVMKLFQILPANVAYFGRKDYQQLTVIRHMAEDLNVPIRIEGCATVRETDGLAMSSRNRYLSLDQRHTALSLWRALTKVREMATAGEQRISELESAMERILRAGGVDRIDYARVVDAESLEDLEHLDRAAVALIAVHVGATRLIDNLLLPH